jgi:hypothetical protein
MGQLIDISYNDCEIGRKEVARELREGGTETINRRDIGV